MQHPYSTIESRIQFVNERDGVRRVRGGESARYDFHADGSISFSATSVSHDPRVCRSVVYSLAADFRPLEAFVRIQNDGAFEGSGWFRFEPGRVSARTHNAATGEHGREIAIDGRANGFCAHPVTTDALLCAAYDHSRAERSQRPTNLYSSSPDPYGRVGPDLVGESIVMRYFGREPLDTPAGTLQADRYGFSRDDAPDEVLQHVWCLAGTAVFLHSRAAGTYGTRYELTELTVRPA